MKERPPLPGRELRNKRDVELREILANSISHGLGVVFAIVALVILAAAAQGFRDTLACVIFGGTLILLYTCSTLYHAFPRSMNRVVSLFRRFDHSAVYLLIAGTYTPFVVLLAPSTSGYALLIALWVAAIVGVILKQLWIDRFRVVHVVIFLIMGWSVLVIWEDVYATIPGPSLWLLLGGGLSYTLGVAFFAVPLPFFHMVWHVFVLGGSITHFLSILYIL